MAVNSRVTERRHLVALFVGVSGIKGGEAGVAGRGMGCGLEGGVVVRCGW